MRKKHDAVERELRLLAQEVSLERGRSERRSVALPGELWGRIVAVARKVGVNRTSKALGLWYYAVKKRVVAHQDTGRGGESLVVAATSVPAVSFVELPASALAPSEQGCVIEMRRGDGASVTVSQAGVEHVAAVARSFLGART